MAVGDAHVFPAFLTPVLTQLFFPTLWQYLDTYCREHNEEAIKNIHFLSCFLAFLEVNDF